MDALRSAQDTFVRSGYALYTFGETSYLRTFHEPVVMPEVAGFCLRVRSRRAASAYPRSASEHSGKSYPTATTSPDVPKNSRGVQRTCERSDFDSSCAVLTSARRPSISSACAASSCSSSTTCSRTDGCTGLVTRHADCALGFSGFCSRGLCSLRIQSVNCGP